MCPKLFIFKKFCRVPIWGALFTIDVSKPKPKPNRPNTMNLVQKRAWELGLCEDAFNGQAGSSGNWIVHSVVGGKVKAREGRGWFLLLLFWYSTNRTSWRLPNCRPPSSWNLPGYISFCSLHLGRPSVDCAGRHLSVCPIQRFPQLAVSGSV